ncbi:hypothetical protein JK636_12095 [Clostridium sp. YIM B02515]|uniref:Uncharacterized protein n=1 Tax=Clostridium rhizosphaerae TaxID=2803861 RepID=A0ABS1TAW0_9CLOT|nr:hypothetical protein [Clostridium rhizosphaerae]MBL4936498.1 hypothetical protein [Clostridium rhizosphaerae]
MYTVLAILSILLSVLSTVLIVKNFLINVNTSSRALINIMFIVLLIASLVCALGGSYGGIVIPQAIAEFNAQKSGLTNEMIAKYLININHYTNETIIFTILGYAFFGISFLLLNKIKKEKAEEHSKVKTWNFDKINNKS